MRRRPGIAGLQRDHAAREQFKATGKEVKDVSAASMREQLALFRARLEEFAVAYKADIRRDPIFRAQFHTMCANIGVDPLASNKGMWAELLGFGDFYYELGVQIIEACLATRPLNGGLMELGELTRAVTKRRGRHSEAISEDDVVRALKKLQVLGNGYALETIGRSTYVRSVPGELNMDRNKAMEAAQERGYTTLPELRQCLGWGEQRCDEALQALLKEGLAMVDDQAPDGQRRYYFPCLGTGQQPAAAAGQR